MLEYSLDLRSRPKYLSTGQVVLVSLDTWYRRIFYTTSLLRPLLRLLFSTFFPDLLFMRLRNPCVFFRFLRLG